MTNADKRVMISAWLKAKNAVAARRPFRQTDRIRLERASVMLQLICTNPETVEVQGKVITKISQFA